MRLAFRSAKDPELKNTCMCDICHYMFFLQVHICGYVGTCWEHIFRKCHHKTDASETCTAPVQHESPGVKKKWRWAMVKHLPHSKCLLQMCFGKKTPKKTTKTVPNQECFEVLNHIYMYHGMVKVCFLLVCVISPRKQY